MVVRIKHPNKLLFAFDISHLLDRRCLFPNETGPHIHISTIHPAASSKVQAAQTVGGAIVTVQDAAKRVQYERVDLNDYTFVQLVNTYGRLVQGYLRVLGIVVASPHS